MSAHDKSSKPGCAPKIQKGTWMSTGLTGIYFCKLYTHRNYTETRRYTLSEKKKKRTKAVTVPFQKGNFFHFRC